MSRHAWPPPDGDAGRGRRERRTGRTRSPRGRPPHGHGGRMGYGGPPARTRGGPAGQRSPFAAITSPYQWKLSLRMRRWVS